MAKIIISADIHFCKRESLVENRYPFLVDSFKWLNEIDGDVNIDLGDMFNSANLSAEDVSVLSQIKFNREWHCIAGNHDIDGSNSLLKYFRELHIIYEKPQLKNLGKVGGWVLFLPFTKEPQPLDILLGKLPVGEKVTIFSHCEFVGMFGAEKGYTVTEIEKDDRIKMWFNGHYHTRTILSPKVVIVGNLLGKNFTQNFDPHGVCVYDSVENTYEFIENPHALCFGKMDTAKEEVKNIRKLIEEDPIKRYVLAIQCDADLKDMMKEWSDKYLVASRVVVSGGVGLSSIDVEDSAQITIDHIEMFFNEVCIRYGKEIADAIRTN